MVLLYVAYIKPPTVLNCLKYEETENYIFLGYFSITNRAEILCTRRINST